MRTFVSAVVLCTSAWFAACGVSGPRPGPSASAPEGASGWTDKPGWSASTWMVAAANPLAVDAGYAMLDAGGSAVDAAIAVQMVLTLVEPQSSGIGGGAFLLHWDGTAVTALDGRETAPAAATEALFMHDGVPLTGPRAITGGRSVGVPGVLRMLAVAHQRHGRLAWARLFEPAIRLADDGFLISPRLARLLRGETALASDPAARAHFFTEDGTAKTAGTRLRNPQLAAVLRELASAGADRFYTGRIARDIVTKVTSHPTNPGVLSEADLASYAPRERTPLCFDYRTWRICGLPPPSSGTVALGQILGALESRALGRHAPRREPGGRWILDPEAVHAYAEAARLAYADRDAYLGDPDFVDVPVAGLLDPAYVRRRAALIGNRSMGVAPPGVPPGLLGDRVVVRGAERPSTSHISIVDAFGQALSMTTTVEDAFGSRQMVHGFMLNNQLTDFSAVPRDAAGHLVANRVQPGKRPRSSMTPVLVFDRATGRLEMTLGSPGGSAIVNYVGKVLIGTLDWGLTLQEAMALPNFGSRNGPTELEAGRVDAALAPALEARGHIVELTEQTSGVQGIERTASGWFGGADPRREGVARGR